MKLKFEISHDGTAYYIDAVFLDGGTTEICSAKTKDEILQWMKTIQNAARDFVWHGE